MGVRVPKSKLQKHGRLEEEDRSCQRGRVAQLCTGCCRRAPAVARGGNALGAGADGVREECWSETGGCQFSRCGQFFQEPWLCHPGMYSTMFLTQTRKSGNNPNACQQ